jgi:flavin reductase (DIM6/NTAB) family NADH-FMN oxidoreductase RutF
MQTQIAPVDQKTFRSALATYSSGVTIVTLCYEGHCYGLTVSSFCSLSLNPPLVLICVDQRCQSHDLIEKVGTFAVNILAEDSAWLAAHFASRMIDKFADIPHHWGETEMPLLDQALATIECSVVNQFPGGDHSIFVGSVVAARVSKDMPPLIYQRSHYCRLVQ